MNEALILIDIQNDYFPGGKFPLLGIKKAATEAEMLLKRFREKKLPVIHIQHINIRHNRFFLENTEGVELFTKLKPLEGEKHIIKHNPNSFKGTDLESYLKIKSIKTLHIAGAMTNMCIDSTVRAAFDKDYKVILYENACAAPGILRLPIIHKLFSKNLGSKFCRINKV